MKSYLELAQELRRNFRIIFDEIAASIRLRKIADWIERKCATDPPAGAPRKDT